jgi:hypothetical protein
MDLLDQYLQHLAHQPNRFGRSVLPATIRAARAEVRGFVGWWEHHHRLTFDPALVLERDLCVWQEDRQQHHGAKPSTINRWIIKVISICGRARLTDLYT